MSETVKNRSAQLRSPQRLGGRKAVGALFERGEVGRSRLVMVRLLPNEAGTARVAVIAARRLGNAVLRNRLRRRLRAAVRRIADELPAADLAVLAKREVATVDFADLVQSLRQAIKRATEPRK